MPEPQYRDVAESLLSSVSPQNRTLTHSASLNLVPEDLVAGHRPGGRMSTVRRFFCLFVTFDLLFTALMWLICVMMRGQTLQQIFDSEIIQYNVKSSLFDIIMAALCRFTVLLLFYAILYINNWSIIALSTACTCAFLIGKVFVFDWPDASEPVYEVFLILTSFTLSWGEAWFLDFRVLPQELQAKQILESIVHHHPSERTPLLAPAPSGLAPGSYAESTVKWFSPVDTPEASPRPRQHGDPVILTQEQIDEYKSQARKSMQDAHHIVTLPNWTLEKRGAHKGDVVESRRTEQFGKVYRFTGVVECPPQFLFSEFKHNIGRLPEWNPTVLKSEVIKEISEGIELSYQVTAGGGRGIISPRDFVILRCSEALPPPSPGEPGPAAEPEAYISSGVSVSVPGYPPRRDLVRGQNKVGCWFLKPCAVRGAGGGVDTHTTFQWLMCCDLKGKIPQFVLDAAFATVMLDYIVHVRKFVADARARAAF